MNPITTSRKLLPTTVAAALAGVLLMTGCTKKSEETPATDTQAQTDTAGAESGNKRSAVEQASIDRLVISYADMAHAAYKDSLDTAKMLQTAINTFVDAPTEANLDAAKAAYKAARTPYSQTEIFRFDQGFVGKSDKRAISSTDDWEGQLNAWPLDEALIDYVSDDYQGEYNSKDNIINSESISVGSLQKDTSNITPELLADLSEVGGSEANVTTGYHAIEFLLWGQDTNGVGAGAGNRPVSDYQTGAGECTSGSTSNEDAKVCTRRGAYLKAAAQLLVDDLSAMEAQWRADSTDSLRSDFLARKDDNALRQIMYQMGSLALGELASERMQVAFVTGSTEDEHECFSDLTHLSYANNARGIQNIFEGNYETVSGDNVGGYGLQKYLVDTNHKDAADKLAADFQQVSNAFNTIVVQGEEQGVKVDQMIATVGQADKVGVAAEEQTKRRGYIEAAISSLQNLTSGIENAANAIGIDNLDADTGSQF
ncbi:imelysin family protein [Psychrobacter aestuarii]|uniref:Imelysin family protein n=1 Tax=Psychrobacter aestuarii TaxID=556327 RepID=A0ABP3FIC9_9GAMM|nr:imelysin family protein [Psychrobacter aestuarii]